MNLNKTINYRADIDGLRAIAVIAVILFHAFPNNLKGGFIGVDIFFVISGYLITSILQKNIQNEPCVSKIIKSFYSRRIRRIFPSLQIVIAITIILGWFLLLADEFRQLGKHIIGANTFISNIILWSESGYFDNASVSKPLLHLWSLGIEEQFYIFFPLLMIFLIKHKSNKIYIISMLAVLSFSSSIYSLYYFTKATQFYLPSNRVWELMVGAILAFYGNKTLTINKQNFFSIIGIISIIASMLIIKEKYDFPGFWALLPVFGTSLIILGKNSFINKYYLSNKFIVYIGLISYPLYLWHWPFISYLNICEITNKYIYLSSIFISLLLSICSYEFIEKKLRRNNSTYLSSFFISISILYIIIGFPIYNGNIEPRNNSNGVNLALDAIGDWQYAKVTKPIKINGIGLKKIEGGSKKIVLFYGDSHIEQYAPRIAHLIEKNPDNYKSVIFATRGGCPPVNNVYEDLHKACNQDFKDTAFNLALSDEIDSVVIGASWGYFIKKRKSKRGNYRYFYQKNNKKYYFDQEGIMYALNELEDMIRTISSKKKIYFLLDNPTGKQFDPKSFFEGTRITGYKDKLVLWQEYDEKQNKVRLILKQLAEKAGASVIDPVEHFCQDGKCKTALPNGKPIYKDSGHIRPFYVRDYITYLDQTIVTENANRVAGRFFPPAPTTPCVRIHTGRFTKVTEP